MLLRKIKNSFEKKNSFTEGFFSSDWKSSKKKESLYGESSHKKYSYQRPS